MISIDEAQVILDSVAEELPPAFFKDLNGGIILLPEVKKSPEEWADNLYTLGQYIYSPSMGRYIAIYYGSFSYVFGENASEERIAEELRKTLLHEFTHHLESLAGEKGLEIEDEKRMRMYRERAMRVRRPRDRKQD